MTRSAPYNAMPGSFAASDRVGPKSHLFQPPRTPSASSSVYLSRSNASLFSEVPDRSTIAGRKRSRHDYNVESNATPASMTADWSNGVDTGDSMARSESMDPGSPIPFVNTRYQLAGGLDTPSALQNVEESVYPDVGYRKRLSGGETEGKVSGHNPYFERQAPQFTDANGRPRSLHSSTQRSGWGQAAFEVVGGVVGRVWEFCKAGAFRGFSAGGGKAYQVNDSQPHTPVHQDTQRFEMQESGTVFYTSRGRESTPIPGEYIDDDFEPDYNDPQSRPAKRLQLNNEDGELAKNWVIVSGATKTNITTTPHSSSKSAARYTMPTASSVGRRPASNAAFRPASRAMNRRTPLSLARPSIVSHAGSPGLHPTRPASFASPRSPGGSRMPPPPSSKVLAQGLDGKTRTTSSPVSIEAQKWAAKLKKEKSQTDESIQRFSAQLQAMIREGKEALGTTVQVDEMEDLEL